jgi:hypothetical protein
MEQEGVMKNISAIEGRLKMNINEQLRSNLKYLIDVCEDFHQDLENEIDGHYDILPNYIGAAEKFLRRIKEVKSAISLPRRNCDVGTAEEQVSRHSKWCAKSRDFSCAPSMCRKCYAKWSQMPYESEVK